MGTKRAERAAKRLHVAARTPEIKQLATRCALAAIEGDASRLDGREGVGRARRPWPRPRSVGQVFLDRGQQWVEGAPAADAVARMVGMHRVDEEVGIERRVAGDVDEGEPVRGGVLG